MDIEAQHRSVQTAHSAMVALFDHVEACRARRGVKTTATALGRLFGTAATNITARRHRRRQVRLDTVVAWLLVWNAANPDDAVALHIGPDGAVELVVAGGKAN